MRILLLLSMILMLSPAARAADDDAVDLKAESLKTLITDVLQDYRNAYALKGSVLATEGPITVERSGTFYAATLPAITLTDSTGQRADIGMVAVNATPGVIPGTWKMSVALPTPMRIFDENNRPLRVLHIGTQKMSGVWHEALQVFTALDATYGNVKVEDFESLRTASIPEIRLRTGLKETAPDLWSGDMAVESGDIAVKTPDGTDVMILKGIKIASTAKDIPLAAQRAVQEKLRAFGKNTSPEDLKNMGREEKLALYDMFTEIWKASGNTLSVNATLDGLKATIPAAQKGGASRTVALDDASISINADNLKGEAATLSMKGAFNPLSVTPQGPDTDLLPQTMAIDVKMEGIPLAALTGMGRKAMENSGNQAAQKLGFLQDMLGLPGILAASGSRLTINDTALESRVFGLETNGSLIADASAAAKATGTLQVKAAGLDALIVNLQAKRATAPVKDQARIDNAIQQLTVISAVGQQEGEKNGKPVKVYNISLDKSGKTLLNGTDISVLMGAGGAKR